MPEDQEVDLNTLGEALAYLTEPYQEAKNSVKSRSVATAPSAPAVNDGYIIPSAATGGWAGHVDQLAIWTNGAWKFETPTEGVSVWVDDENKQVTFDGGAWITTSGTGAVSTTANKAMVARTTTGDHQLACDVALQLTPAPGSHVAVLLNGVVVTDVGDGTRDGVSCYFSSDSGVTALAWSALSAGAALYWNGTVAGFPLAPTDVFSFDYQVAAA